MFQTQVREKIITHLVFSKVVLKIMPFMRKCGKNIVEQGRPQRQYGTCTMHAGYLRLQIHTLRLCNTHCFSTATMAVWWAVRVGGGLVRGFISIPFPSLARLLIGHHGKVKGMSGFPRFPLWKRFMFRSLLFLLLFGSYHLGFDSPNLLLPGAGAWSSFISCLFQEGPA